MPDKVAILGTVPASRGLAPFNDETWEIWVCSAGNRRMTFRVTRWFEIHSVTDLKGEENAAWVPDYFSWLREQTFPVYMQEHNDLLPQAKIFPRRKVLHEFGDLGRIAFTSSIAWMIGYAIYLGAKEISVFGVDMAATEELYGHQKAGCQIMMALAKQRGIQVVVPHESCLATPPPLYGYSESSRMGRKLIVRENEIKSQIASLDQTIARMNNERNFFAGALENCNYVRRTFVDGEHDAEIDDQAALENSPIVEKALAAPETIAVDTLASGLLVPSGVKPNGSLHAE